MADTEENDENFYALLNLSKEVCATVCHHKANKTHCTSACHDVCAGAELSVVVSARYHVARCRALCRSDGLLLRSGPEFLWPSSPTRTRTRTLATHCVPATLLTAQSARTRTHCVPAALLKAQWSARLPPVPTRLSFRRRRTRSRLPSGTCRCTCTRINITTQSARRCAPRCIVLDTCCAPRCIALDTCCAPRCIALDTCFRLTCVWGRGHVHVPPVPSTPSVSVRQTHPFRPTPKNYS